MTLGVEALTRFQSGLEVTPGTPVAASRIDYWEPGSYLEDKIEVHKPNEAHNSYVRNYRSMQVKRNPALTGVKWSPCFQTLPRYLQYGAAGGISSAKTLAVSAAADDIIDTASAHGLAENDVVKFTSLTGGTGLSTNTLYYVIGANLAATTFQVSATPGGSAALFSADITAGSVVKWGVGGGAGDSGSPEMYAYAFKRVGASNDLQHATLEVGNNVQEWDLEGSVLNRWDLKFTAGGPMSGTMDWLALKATESTFTPSLADTTPDDIVGAMAVVYIDDTTIGSTLAAYPLDLSFSHDNGWAQLHALIGQITAKENYRPMPSKADLELKVAFDGVSEYDKFVAHTLRKIRLSCDGPVIHDAVKHNLALDWYGKWDAYDMGSDGGLHVATIKGESFYNEALGSDWQIVVNTNIATIP